MSGKSSIKLVMTIILLQDSDRRDVTFHKNYAPSIFDISSQCYDCKHNFTCCGKWKKSGKKKNAVLAISQQIYIYNKQYLVRYVAVINKFANEYEFTKRELNDKRLYNFKG